MRSLNLGSFDRMIHNNGSVYDMNIKSSEVSKLSQIVCYIDKNHAHLDAHSCTSIITSKTLQLHTQLGHYRPF